MPYRKLWPSRPSTPHGTVYVLHFDQPFKHANHYIGFTTRTVEDRLVEHIIGDGSKFLAKVVAAGITFRLAVVFPNVDLRYEYQLKNRGGAKRVCPICQEKSP
jgi:predicted GIY-YIG superfamily endonuclease